MKRQTFAQVKNNGLQACFLILMALMLADCDIAMYRDQQSSQIEHTPSINSTVFALPQQLRIKNIGSENIYDLQILFPGDTADAEAIRIRFGDIPVGGITEYRSAPGGVYRYAAYEYLSNGRLVNQPVMDWMGESPLQGEQFTYRIALDSNMVIGNQIQLIEIVIDKR